MASGVRTLSGDEGAITGDRASLVELSVPADVVGNGPFKRGAKWKNHIFIYR